MHHRRKQQKGGQSPPAVPRMDFSFNSFTGITNMTLNQKMNFSKRHMTARFPPASILKGPETGGPSEVCTRHTQSLGVWTEPIIGRSLGEPGRHGDVSA